MKKRTIALVSLLLCLALLLTACNGGGGDSSSGSGQESSVQSQPSSSGESSSEAQDQPTGGENWVTDTPVTLKVWCMREDNVENIETNEFIKWLQAETNVTLEFEQASSAEALQKFNLSLASGSYPDVYLSANQINGMNSTIMNSTLMKFGSAGVLIPLNDLIEQYGTNTKQLFDDVSYIKDGVTMPDGNIYALPIYSEIYHCRYSQKLWIDQSWLDNLKLETPTTTEEYYQVLKAFKEQDANGNGDPNDEIPLAGCTDAWHSDPSSFLMNAFIYDDDDKRLMVKDDQVDSILNKDEYREGLRYIHKLYDEGLLYFESFAQDSTQLKSLASSSPNVVGGFAVGAPMAVLDASCDLYQTARTLAPLKGPNGVQNCGYYGYQDMRVGAYMITSACENPEAAFKLADFMYTLDSSIRLRQGIYGVDWREAESGEKTFDGKEATYARITPLVTDGGAQNNHFGNSGLFRESNDSFIGAWAVDDSFDIRSLNGIEQLLIEQTWPYDGFEPDQTLPPVIFTEEEGTEVSSIEVEVQKYAKEQRALFITGQKDIETEWDAYVQGLENLGLSKMVEYYNSAYQRQYGK